MNIAQTVQVKPLKQSNHSRYLYVILYIKVVSYFSKFILQALDYDHSRHLYVAFKITFIICMYKGLDSVIPLTLFYFMYFIYLDSSSSNLQFRSFMSYACSYLYVISYSVINGHIFWLLLFSYGYLLYGLVATSNGSVSYYFNTSVVVWCRWHHMSRPES